MAEPGDVAASGSDDSSNPKFIQPESLKTDEYLADNGGTGNEIWAMFLAAGTGDIPALKALLEREPQLVHCEFLYRPPLHFAVRERQVEAVKVLLEGGARPWASSGSGTHETPIQIAGDREYHEILDLLTAHMESTHGSTTGGADLDAAIRSGDLNRVAKMMDASPGMVGMSNVRGDSGLFTAVSIDNFSMVDLLLDKGADIDAYNAHGNGILD